MTIFKEYDVRGIYPSEINEKIFYEIGRAIKILGVSVIAIGRDGRLSSDSLFEHLTRGLIDSGVDVIDLGKVTSPILSFYCVKKKTFGAMITASHNPKEYNGVKIIDKKGIQLSYNEGLNKIEKSIGKYDKNSHKGKLRKLDFIGEYHKYILKKFRGKFDRKLRVIFDCSNGVGFIALNVIESLNIESFVINKKMDGRFPNHSSDQTKKENLAQLKREVKFRRADIGVMFDGDADRCAFVDEKGKIVPIYIAFLLMALAEIRRAKTKPLVLCDLRLSKIVNEEIKLAGGATKTMRVGNPFYKKELHKNPKAILAGEFSGHIMFKENYGIDDPLFASLKLISIISNSENKFSEFISKYNKYYSTGEISYIVAGKEKVFREVKNRYFRFGIKKMDGISVRTRDFWFNLRKSNTENKIKLVIEGVDKNVVEENKKIIERIVRNG